MPKSLDVDQKREIGIVNLPSCGNRNALSRTADVCHPEQSADGGRRRSETSSVIRAPTIPPKIAFANHAMANIRSSLIVWAAADSRAPRLGGRSAFGSHHARFRVTWEGTMALNKRPSVFDEE